MERFRPAWIAVAITTCVAVGSTVNRCLLCAWPVEASAPIAVEGDPFLEEEAEVPGEEEVPRAAMDIEPVSRPLPSPAPEPPRPAGLEAHEDLTFDKLASYPYVVEELLEGQTPKEQVPASVRALHGRKVAIKGFMIPYRNDGEKVTEFILLRNQGLCCFGIVPRMNEWIHVRMAPGEHAPYATDIPITVFGALEVGETREWQPGRDGVRRGVLMSLYRMESTAVLVPPMFR